MKIKSFTEFSTPVVKEDETITKKIVYRNEDDKDDEAVPFENEVTEEDGAEEIQMAMGELERIGDYADMIMDKIKVMPDLEAWVQSKITKAKDYVTTVHDYLDGVDGVKESVNEGVSPTDMDKIKGAVEAASSFMSVGGELKKLGMKYTFATEPLPIYIIQPTPNNKVAIVNKKYATKPDFVVGDIAVGIMNESVNETENLNESTRWQVGTIDKKGNIESAYVHYDGYPENVKPLLTKHYTDKKKIADLMKLAKVAGVSYLAPELGAGKQNFNDPDNNTSLFYGRDRGEKGKSSATLRGDASSIEDYIRNASNDGSADYVYLYDERDGKWYYASYKDKTLKTL